MNKAYSGLFRLFHFLINAIIMVFSLSCIFPIFWMINASLRDNRDFMADPTGIVKIPLFHNYIDALLTGNLWRAFLNSAYLSILTVLLVILFSFVVGFMISRYHFIGSRIIYILFLAGMLVPILSLMIPVFIEFKTLGIANQWFTLLFPYTAFGLSLAVILMENFIKTLPVELDEAAYLEGSGTLPLMFRIIFPLTRPILFVITITSFIGAWNEYPFSLILVSNMNLRTISIGIRLFGQAHSFNYTLYFAALVISIAPILVLYSCFSKHIVKGMTMGAIKG
ncbi:ABC transporter permease [Spirochaetia bacterium]|nr:ABC transporter permease [Spirochaetia bacterium]